jgi:hypothetical protein
MNETSGVATAGVVYLYDCAQIRNALRTAKVSSAWAMFSYPHGRGQARRGFQAVLTVGPLADAPVELQGRGIDVAALSCRDEPPQPRM